MALDWKGLGMSRSGYRLIMMMKETVMKADSNDKTQAIIIDKKVKKLKLS